ncbi:MAG: aldo/keto reductase [Caldilineaceae bacterium]|nr:aldo/keto reductase [Caldilineaceae bacterium]
MNYVPFGATGATVSKMCLGTMMFGARCDQTESDRILGTAMDHGVTFIDTAAMYVNGGTESILGNILKGRRDKLFIATKVDNIDPNVIRSSIDESLQRMQIDAVDLYLLHWPKSGMNPTAMMAALNDVVQAGKARFVGCCNYPAWLLAHFNGIADRQGWPRLVCNQIPYNPIERGVEVEVLPQALAENIAITIYRPLAFGIFAGKYQPGTAIPEDSRGTTDPRIPRWLEKYGDGIGRFLEFAADHQLHPAQLIVAWLCHSAAVTTPIIGVSSERQLHASLNAFEVTLSDAEYAEVTAFFDTAVKEEAGGAFAGLRRDFSLVQPG